MSLQILELSESKFEQWDAFVAQADSATFFHRAGWKRVIERAFKHRTYFLYAEENGAIVGVLPLVHIKSRLFGSALTSTPFCVYGGIVALHEQAEAELRKRACELAKELKVSALEMRNIERTSNGWPTKELYYTFRKSLSENNEENMLAIPRKRRAMIRGGIKANLQSEEDAGWERFFATYAESVRNLGTPVFSQKLFCYLREEFGQDCRVLMITHEGKDVAGLMSFYFKDQVLPYYAGSFDSAKHLKAHDFMYWELMRRSVDEGYRVFDFGRSKKDTGPYLFKKGWGFEPELLNYEFFLVESDSIPEVNPNNPKYKLFIDMWKKLPLPVANRLGPLLSRSLG